MPKAVEAARRLYDKDRFAAMDSDVAARHLGYGGLNGGSRTLLSALRKFGLIEYGTGQSLKLSEAAKSIFLPAYSGEAEETLTRLLMLPKEYQRLEAKYPRFELPSDATVQASLVRHMGYTEKAAKSFLKDVKESVEYVQRNGRVARKESSPDEQPDPAREERAQSRDVSIRTPVSDLGSIDETDGFQKLIMPGSDVFLLLPRELDEAMAKRMKRWLTAIVVPTLEFAAGETE